MDEYKIIENLTHSDFTLIHPFRLLIVGPTSSGKTTWTKNLILNKEKLIDKPITDIYYIYGQEQDAYNELKDKIIFSQDISLIEQNFGPNTLIILDDLQEELTKHIDKLKKLFIKRSHHEQISVIIILQNIFSNSNFTKTIRINISNYYILKHSFGFDQLEVLGRQLEGFKKSKHFLEAYNIATCEPFSGLFVDLHPLSKTKDIYRYRYYKNGDILSPIFLVNSENVTFI